MEKLTGCVIRVYRFRRGSAVRWPRLQVFTGLLYINVVVVNKRSTVLWITSILSFHSTNWKKQKRAANMFVRGGKPGTTFRPASGALRLSRLRAQRVHMSSASNSTGYPQRAGDNYAGPRSP